MKYAVVIEKGKNSYGAYVPDLPGCVAVSDTAEEVQRLIREAIGLHIEGLKEEGLPVPEPVTHCEYVSPGRRTATRRARARKKALA
ncbi:MAG: hypothetical protein A3F84_05815 [Candidatus Handelsmanbacteria bacterium RIFCSPLOWO2_12_FULL_64_10]|uniref:HicB-like antitoxin of toxin-antitoxin system domain-containing protein n=1 Tax=Handelsmanbacteria sp. (strain RIFCSPLOWO2_12_FULL_64_10) TaxID=1817868 RepID=A0A1F6CA81_HANXR|nr:MAG: hypothetical protein A3F84_05815 [Candidatus Handelsmanbacteria bacterium RIFCSPLOWO2_12_FULL_64_10]